jgi:hypothetical protein
MCLHLDQPQSLFLVRLKRKRNNHSFIQSFEKTKQQVQKEVKRLLLIRKRMHDEHQWWSWCDGNDGPWYNSSTSFIIGYISLEQFHRFLVCNLVKIFLASKIHFPLYFQPPPTKLKFELQTNGKLLIATRLDQSSYQTNKRHVLSFILPFTNFNILWKNVTPKQLACFDFFSSNFLLLGHILRTNETILPINIYKVYKCFLIAHVSFPS